jgi:hypothetical protein
MGHRGRGAGGARGGRHPAAERGTPIFPLDPDGYDGEPIAFLAGDPIAHDESLREVLGAVEAG